MSTFSARQRAGAVCLVCLLLLSMTACFAMAVVWPQAGGTTKQDGSLVVDVSNASKGYIMAKAKKSGKWKLRISRGDVTYTYDLNGDGEYEVFPLQLGSGSYQCSLYKNVKANKYSKNAQLTVKVSLEDECAAFLCPSQYVNYTEDSPAVQASMEICEGLETDAEKVEAIRSYMVRGFAYDYVRALTSAKSYLGDVDGCYETRMGLCMDLAAVAACMLRVQGIPTQLCIGYAGDVYHAWNNVLIDGEYQRLDVTAQLNGMPKEAEYTTERIY